MADKADIVHAEITQAFITALEEGIADPAKWSPPWAKGISVMNPINPITGRQYNGGNRLICAIHSWQYNLGRQWATYDQWASLSTHTDSCYAERAIGHDKYSRPHHIDCMAHGCVLINVRRGERSMCTLLRPLSRKEINEQGMEATRIIGFAPFKVFNASQVDGFEPEQPQTYSIEASVEDAFKFAELVGAEVEESMTEGASFVPRPDKIILPARNRWSDPARCFSTVAHELTHWTGHPHRLAREPQVAICAGQPYSREDYAREELVAELGAAFTCAWFDQTSPTRDDHVHYLKSWLAILADDPKALWQAAGKAERASQSIIDSYNQGVGQTEAFTVVGELIVEV